MEHKRTDEVTHITVTLPTSFSVHLHHHGIMSEQLVQAFAKIERLIMATAQQFEAGFERVNVATSAIATLIRKLVASQQAGNLSAAEEEAAQAKLLAVADALEAMAATPTDPVPTPVPTDFN